MLAVIRCCVTLPSKHVSAWRKDLGGAGQYKVGVR